MRREDDEKLLEVGRQCNEKRKIKN